MYKWVKKKQNEIICVLSFFHSIFFNNLCSSRRISTTKLAKYSVGVVRWCWNYTCGSNFFLADISLFFIVSPIFLFGDIKQTVYGVIAHTTFVIIQLQALKVLYWILTLTFVNNICWHSFRARLNTDTDITFTDIRARRTFSWHLY